MSFNMNKWLEKMREEALQKLRVYVQFYPHTSWVTGERCWLSKYQYWIQRNGWWSDDYLKIKEAEWEFAKIRCQLNETGMSDKEVSEEVVRLRNE